MSNEKDAKLKALKLTLDKLDKAYGKGTVMKMSDQAVVDVEAIPSGSLRFRHSTWCWRISKRSSYRNIWSRIIR